MLRIHGRCVAFLACAVVGTLLAPNPGCAGEFNKVLDVGDAAPTWKNLTGTDEKEHSTSDLSQTKAVVVVFTCNKCPVAVAYEDRLIELAKAFAAKNVATVAINANKNESVEAMKTRADAKGFPFVYVYDETQQVAKDFGATCTPHVFVLDGDRKVAYMGAVDDSMNAAKVKNHYLKDAVDAVLAGEAPETTETQQFGCGIKWK